VERPAYPPLWLEPQFFGATVRFFERSVVDGFAVDPSRVARALSACGRAASVWITNLHNPTGVATDAETLAEVGAAAARAGARL
ncbi:aminotransferase class I/II-fold pyridoxal phosphate-dependent enzyme, partial [Enterococcus faecalis]|uniref:aminotransferase class I/II-fold pyridoxal phosphate-dependent enzyme n=1 Tax=Enterococcus faecalis TaxID=1351 RepID=UPI0021B155E9